MKDAYSSDASRRIWKSFGNSHPPLSPHPVPRRIRHYHLNLTLAISSLRVDRPSVELDLLYVRTFTILYVSTPADTNSEDDPTRKRSDAVVFGQRALTNATTPSTLRRASQTPFLAQHSAGPAPNPSLLLLLQAAARPSSLPGRCICLVTRAFGIVLSISSAPPLRN